MSWENVLKEKLLCPMCGERSFGVNINAKGREKNMMNCTECGYKKRR